MVKVIVYGEKNNNGFITSKVKEDGVDAELPDIDSLIKKLTSDEYIEKKIKDVLGDDMADGKTKNTNN